MSLEYINKAIELRPDYCKYYISRSIWEISAKSNQDASETQLRTSINDINKAIDLGCNEGYTYSMRGARYKKLGFMKLAKDDYQKALILIKDTSYLAYYDRATIKLELEDYYGAIKDFSKAVQMNEEIRNVAYGMRGYCKGQIKDYKGEIVDFTKQLNLNSSSPLTTGEIYYNRGTIKKKLNDINGACEDWRKAGDLGYMAAFDMIKTNCSFSNSNNKIKAKAKEKLPSNKIKK
jgi:tetratricopeptide (TPR) repeat protein